MPPGRSSLARAKAPAALINGLGGKAPWPFSPAPHPRQTRSGRGMETDTKRPLLGVIRYNAISYVRYRRGSPRLTLDNHPFSGGWRGFESIEEFGLPPRDKPLFSVDLPFRLEGTFLSPSKRVASGGTFAWWLC